NLFVESGRNPIVLVEVNFLTENTTEKLTFTYDMVQKRAADGVEIGGERFFVNKPPREELFLANGFMGTPAGQLPGIELQASSINEPASYRWYNAVDTSLVETGMSITVNPAQNTDYLLEITAT